MSDIDPPPTPEEIARARDQLAHILEQAQFLGGAALKAWFEATAKQQHGPITLMSAALAMPKYARALLLHGACEGKQDKLEELERMAASIAEKLEVSPVDLGISPVSPPELHVRFHNPKRKPDQS